VPDFALQTTPYERPQRYINAAKREIELSALFLGRFSFNCMPLKWKIYYTCCLYIMVWLLFISIFVCLDSFDSAFPFGLETIILPSIFVTLSFLAIAKPLVSIYGIDASCYSKAKKGFFIVNFYCMGIAGSLASFYSAYLIVQSFKYSCCNYLNFFDASFLIANFCAIYTSAFDFILLKKIHKKFFTSIYNFCKSHANHY
jgi:hypothetical protein